MRHVLVLLCLAVGAHSQTASSPAGKWASNLNFFDDNNYDRMELNLSGTNLTGKLGDDAFQGSFKNGRIEGTVKPNPHLTIQLRGSFTGDRIVGTATIVEAKLEFKWEASATNECASDAGPGIVRALVRAGGGVSADVAVTRATPLHMSPARPRRNRAGIGRRRRRHGRATAKVTRPCNWP